MDAYRMLNELTQVPTEWGSVYLKHLALPSCSDQRQL